MNDQEISAMLADVIEHVDYDIYKEMFLLAEEDELGAIDELIKIVRRHLEQSKQR